MLAKCSKKCDTASVHYLRWSIMNICVITFLVIGLSEKLMVSTQEAEQMSDSEQLFRSLFMMRRAEQLAAVKRIKQLVSEDKQKKMVSAVTEKIFTMMLRNKDILSTSDYVPGVSSFPDEEDEELRDALSNVLENTALIGDIILRLPDVAQSILATHKEWPTLLAWGVDFASRSKLLDHQTFKLMLLVSQEMNFTTRDETYTNPYRKATMSKKQASSKIDDISKKKKKKAKDIPRGPRLSSHVEL